MHLKITENYKNISTIKTLKEVQLYDPNAYVYILSLHNQKILTGTSSSTSKSPFVCRLLHDIPFFDIVPLVDGCFVAFIVFDVTTVSG